MTLALSAPIPDAEFEASLAPRHASALRIELWLGTVMVPGFWALDWFVIPEDVWLTLWIRIACAAVGVVLLGLAARAPAIFEKRVDAFALGYSLLVAWSIAVLCFMHEGYESPYYAGIDLLVLCVGLLYSWSARTAVAFNLGIYAFYMGPLLLGILEIRDFAATLTNQFFLISTMLVTALSQHHRRGIERREFEAQHTQKRLLAEVQQLATIDALTGLYNRRHFFRLGEDEIDRARRYAHPLSVLMIDIDHFKSINDNHGHSVGDQVIGTIARRLAACLRKSDIAGRYGGEEFAMVLPETDVDNATTIVAERLRQAIDREPIHTSDGPLKVTISVGVAPVAATRQGLLDALSQADAGLYAAKRAGRNRVIAWSEASARAAEASAAEAAEAEADPPASS
ncbi:MAG: GGDEF domain-containing protein [Myxococcales bacterium]|nr:GGDEF domain-containing protein [Myxococcales bacterium]